MADPAAHDDPWAPPDGASWPEGIPSQSLREVARTDPARTAIWVDGVTVTYGEVDRWVDALAAAVLEALEPGNQRVAHCLSGATAMVVTDLALDRAGKIAVGLRSTDPPSRIQQMVQDAGCSLLVTDLDDLELGPIERLPPFGHPTRRPAPVHRSSVLSIAYTSGSTGAPKGIVQTRRWSAHFPDWARACGATTARRNGLLFAGPTATASLTFGVGLAAGASATVLDLRTTGLEDLPAWIHEHGIDRMLFIPALLRAILATDPDPRLFAGLRTVGFGGDTATWDDVASVRAHFSPDVTITNGFGLTEAGIISWLTLAPTAPLGEGPLPVGRPLPGVSVSIVDDEGRPLPAGVPGEIVVEGIHCAVGYWGRPDETRASFSTLLDGRQRVRTGDAGALTADGMLRQLGRLDDMVKVFGNRVELAEVEAAIRAIEGVGQAAVVPYEGNQGNTRLRAVAVPATGAGATLDGRVLRAILGRRLPVSMIPDSIHVAPAIPMLAAGKVDRDGVAEMVAEAASEGQRYRPASTERERQLVAIWSRVLGVDQLGVDDDFFDLGGDSIRAARLMSELHRLMGVDRAVSVIFEAPTVAQFAAALNVAPGAMDVLVPFRAAGSEPPLFVVHGAGGDILFVRHLLDGLPDDLPVYGIQPPIAVFGGLEPPAATVERLAAQYLVEVRRVQPVGPYRLFGYSLGGVVAFEMARQLTVEGTEVDHLAVGDTRSVASAPLSRSKRLARKWEAVRAAGGFEPLLLPLRFGFRYGRWAVRRGFDDRRTIRRALRRGRSVPPALRDAYLIDVFSNVAKGYVPSSMYDGPLLYLRATTGDPSVPALTRFVTGPVAIVDVACDHDSLVRPPFAAEVATAISAAMVGTARIAPGAAG